METIIHHIYEKEIAEIISEEIIIHKLQDALDLIANISYQEITRIIIKEKNITPVFFKLSSGLAGEILQKCVNYGIKIAVVGDLSKYSSNSFNAFVIECNRGNQFFFVENTEQAREMLGSSSS
ncbi:MAG: DUF4180 domain-containing protein [Melioribacteraceae bacterium]